MPLFFFFIIFTLLLIHCNFLRQRPKLELKFLGSTVTQILLSFENLDVLSVVSVSRNKYYLLDVFKNLGHNLDYLRTIIPVLKFCF